MTFVPMVYTILQRVLFNHKHTTWMASSFQHVKNKTFIRGSADIEDPVDKLYLWRTSLHIIVLIKRCDIFID
jgi:hypothetical protein